MVQRFEGCDLCFCHIVTDLGLCVFAKLNSALSMIDLSKCCYREYLLHLVAYLLINECLFRLISRQITAIPLTQITFLIVLTYTCCYRQLVAK